MGKERRTIFYLYVRDRKKGKYLKELQIEKLFIKKTTKKHIN